MATFSTSPGLNSGVLVFTPESDKILKIGGAIRQDRNGKEIAHVEQPDSSSKVFPRLEMEWTLSPPKAVRGRPETWPRHPLPFRFEGISGEDLFRPRAAAGAGKPAKPPNEGDEIRRLLEGVLGIPESFALQAPDRRSVVTWPEADQFAYLWDSDGKKLAEFRLPGETRSMRFSPSGRWILTGSADGTARVWDRRGHERFKFQHDAEVLSAAFHPDERRIATATLNGLVRLWSLDGEELEVIHDHESPAVWVAFSPDGRYLLSSATGQHETTTVWLLKGEDLCRLADERITRNFTEEERNRYADPLLDKPDEGKRRFDQVVESVRRLRKLATVKDLPVYVLRKQYFRVGNEAVRLSANIRKAAIVEDSASKLRIVVMWCKARRATAVREAEYQRIRSSIYIEDAEFRVIKLRSPGDVRVSQPGFYIVEELKNKTTGANAARHTVVLTSGDFVFRIEALDGSAVSVKELQRLADGLAELGRGSDR